MTVGTVALMCGFFMVVIFCLVGALFIISNKRQAEIENTLKKYEININAVIDEKIPEILDTFVKNVFDDYLVMHVEIVNKDYITQEEETHMIRELGSLCSERISPAMIDKLSLFWSPESIGSVVAEKVYLQVVAYVASHNTVYKQTVGKEIPKK